MSPEESFYKTLHQELLPLLDKVWFTNLSNTASCLMSHLKDINWVGFYLNHNEELLLGPFQGKPACLRIPFGKGVCGTAAHLKKTIIVDDVHSFEGHIACDSASQSEIVVPLIFKDRILGVLDIDSPRLNRFNKSDQLGLESLMALLVTQTQWPLKFLE
jgi:GAF domain-containing protein